MGALGLAVALGVVGVVAFDEVDEAFAQVTKSEFEGVIEALPDMSAVGAWQVSGRIVTVTEATEVDLDGQTLVVGMRVEVEGSTQADGSILASEIEVEEEDDDDDDDDDD